MRIFVRWFLVDAADKAQAKKLYDAVAAQGSLAAWPHLMTGVIDGFDLNDLEKILRPKKVKGAPKEPGLGGKLLKGMDPDKPIVSHVNESFLTRLTEITAPDEIVAQWNAQDSLTKCKPEDLRKLLGELMDFARLAIGKRKPVVQVDTG